MPTPETQAQYDAFVKNGMRMMYGKKGVKPLVQALDGNGDPLRGLASVTAAISVRLVQSAKKAGKPLPPEVVLHGTGELLAQLADFSAESGGHKYADEDLKALATEMAKGFKPGQPQQQQPAEPPAMPAGPAAPPAQPAAPRQLMA
jgi:hypothetical protein